VRPEWDDPSRHEVLELVDGLERTEIPS